MYSAGNYEPKRTLAIKIELTNKITFGTKKVSTQLSLETVKFTTRKPAYKPTFCFTKRLLFLLSYAFKRSLARSLYIHELT